VIRRENVLIISTFHDFPSATDCDKSGQIVNSSPHKNPHSGKSHGKRQLADPPGPKIRLFGVVRGPCCAWMRWESRIFAALWRCCACTRPMRSEVLVPCVLEVVPHIPFWGCKTLEPNRLGVYFQWLQQPSELHCSQRPSPNEFTPRSSVITIQRRKQIAEEPCLQAAPFSSSKVQHSEFSAAAPTQSQ